MSVILNIVSEFDSKGIKLAQRQFAQLETATQKAGFAMKKALVPAVAALGTLGFASFGAAKMASDLNEETSKAEIIFGKASASIMNFSKTAATSLGQSQTEALKAAGTFGVLGKASGLTGTDLADMATKFTTLATDLASFNNTSPEEAVLALGAGLRGESEPLRRYGILLDDATLRQKALALGLVKTTKDALSPANKSLAAQAVILEKTGIQQGNFALTAGDAANQQRIMTAQLKDAQTNIGKAFLPVMVKATGLLSAFGAFASANAGLAAGLAFAIGGLSATIVIINGVMKLQAGYLLLSKAAMIIYTAIAGSTTVANIALATSFTAVQISTFIGIATAVAGAAALVILAKKIKGAVGANVEQKKTTDEVAKAQKAYEQMLKDLGKTIVTTGNETDTAKEKDKKAKEEKKRLADASKKAKEAAAKLKAEIQDLADALREKLNVRLVDAQDKLKKAQDAFDDFGKSVGVAVTGSFDFGSAQSEATGNTADLQSALKKQSEAQDKVNEAYDKWNAFQDKDNLDALVVLQKDLAKATEEVATAQAKPMTFFDTLQIQAEKAKTFGELVSRLMTEGLSEAALSQVLAAGVDGGTLIAKEILGSADGVLKANNLTKSMTKLADDMAAKSAAKYYQSGVDLATDFLKGIQDTIKKVEIILSNPNLTMTDIINAGLIGGFGPPDLSGVDLSGILTGNFGMGTLMAAGGVVTRAQTVTVGEAGPEAIIPLDRMGSMGFNGGMNITVQAGIVSTPDQIGQEIISAILKSQRKSGAVFAPATGLGY